MKKSLAGFDEMNVLNEDGSTGVAGAIAPSVDLSESMKDVKIPSWLEKLKNIGLEIKKIFDIIGLQLSVDLIFGAKALIDVLTGNWIGLILDFIIILINHWSEFKIIIDSVVAIFRVLFDIVLIGLSLIVPSFGKLAAKIWDARDESRKLQQSTGDLQKAEENLKKAREDLIELFNKPPASVKPR